MTDMEHLSIGDFARATGLTPKALRLYDDLGLVRPTRVDPFNGYRWYAREQVEEARLVASLRLIGMPLATIASVLAAGERRADQIASYWRQVEADTASRRQIVDSLVSSLHQERTIMNTTTFHTEIGTSHRQGARERQQDAVLATADWFAVADGFGERDDLAALALEALPDGGYAAAARAVQGLSTSTTSTTLTAVHLEGEHARLVHVGDGRVYRVRAGEVELLTRDHTLVAELIADGRLTPDEARAHPHRSLINRVLGLHDPDESEIDLRAGDRLVLTTDGIHASLEPELLSALVTAGGSAQATADALADAVVRAGEPDNHSAVVVDLS